MNGSFRWNDTVVTWEEARDNEGTFVQVNTPVDPTLAHTFLEDEDFLSYLETTVEKQRIAESFEDANSKDD